MKKQKHYERPDDHSDQYDINYSHQTAYNIRKRSSSRECQFANRKLKYTRANSTDELNLTIFLKESERFDLSLFNDETAFDIANRVSSGKLIVQWPKNKYEEMEEDIKFDFIGYHINMYECKYSFVPDDIYHTLINDIKIRKVT